MTRKGLLDASPDRSEDAGVRYRVRVCMKQYFSDERARAYVCVRGGRRVRWLYRRLRALFPLPPRFALLSCGHLLPPDEPLAVLRQDDVVEVVPSRVNLDVHSVEADDVDSGSRVTASIREFVTSDSNRSGTVPNTGNRRTPNTDPESEVNAVDVDAMPLLSRGAEENDDDDDDDDELSVRKRRALSLLEQYCESEQGNELRATRPRRRRVRRRRRECAPSSVAPGSQPVGDVAVLRNGAGSLAGGAGLAPRAPRLIRPLADAPAP